MSIPGGRNGLIEHDDDLEEEEWVGLPQPQDVPPHLQFLAEAVHLGDVDRLRQALDNLYGSSIDYVLEDGDTALHLACLYGHLPCVQLLLERGASLESKDEDGAIPLHDACAGGFTEIVQLLINAANDPDRVKQMLDTVDIEGDTPLHHAARGEHLEVVHILLNAGASPRTVNVFRKVPAELSEPQTEVRRVLEAACVDV